MLAARARSIAQDAVETRLQLVQQRCEEAANVGCFSLDVPLDGSFGPAQWWWDAINQDLVGDFLTRQGLHCKFRKPLASSHSKYPSLLVSWFEPELVARMVSDKHEQSAQLLATYANGPFLLGEELLVSDCVGLAPRHEDSRLADGLLCLDALQDASERSFNLTVRLDSNGLQHDLTLLVKNWSGTELRSMTVNGISVASQLSWSMEGRAGELRVVWPRNAVHELRGKVKIALA